MAEWRVIPEHPQYWVSDEGEVVKQFATQPMPRLARVFGLTVKVTMEN